VRKQLEVNGKLMLAMLGTGVLLAPLAGWWPLIGIAAACGSWIYVADKLNNRR
jgi:hypothetical protein